MYLLKQYFFDFDFFKLSKELYLPAQKYLNELWSFVKISTGLLYMYTKFRIDSSFRTEVEKSEMCLNIISLILFFHNWKKNFIPLLRDVQEDHRFKYS